MGSNNFFNLFLVFASNRAETLKNRASVLGFRSMPELQLLAHLCQLFFAFAFGRQKNYFHKA
jgi:hypothetical protein